MKRVKLGIFGMGRGAYLGRAAMLGDADIVAVCDNHEKRLEKGAKSFPEAVAYTSFEEFIKHPMDGVILANNFHEHAPFAIKLLEKGINVLCECTSNSTMAEGVRLVRAAEKSSAIFMLAENYPNMKFNREMKRVCRGGTLGKILFAEGEYNHPADPMDISFKKEYVYFPEHWRNFLPRSYYITHSLSPLMSATGAFPKKVTAFACPAPFDADVPSASYSAGDKAAIIMIQNDDGSVFRVTGCAAFGAHGNSYRICGTKGQIENLRGMGEKVMRRYNSWELPEGKEKTNCYEPSWDDKDEELIEKTGHGGGDFLIVRDFVDCIKNGKPHQFDVYFATAMASVAILSHRSILEGGKVFDVPDFRLEEDKRRWENDCETPFHYSDGRTPTIPCCSDPSYAPTQKQMQLFRELVMDEKN